MSIVATTTRSTTTLLHRLISSANYLRAAVKPRLPATNTALLRQQNHHIATTTVSADVCQLSATKPVTTINTSTSLLQQFKPSQPIRNMSSAGNSDTNDKFRLPGRYQGSQQSVWVEYIQLASEYKPLNLGQGFTDYAVPAFIRDALAEVATSPNVLMNQYTRGFGHPRLVKALAQLYGTVTERPIDANSEVLVTVGAYEALYAAIQGHVDIGDEVIIIEPFFDCYEPMVRTAGGIPRFIPLVPTGGGASGGDVSSSDWQLDWTAFEALFNERTKMILLNTPNNPIGKVFTRAELERIAALCRRWNVLCVSDEVYEWLVYPGAEHVRICTLPGMWERTLTIGSAGKTFSVTGWKIGWAYGPQALMRNLQMVHQNSVYTCSTPVQEAIAIALEVELPRLGTAASYFRALPVELLGKRDRFVEALRAAGMRPTVPEGGFFVVADWSPVSAAADLSAETDARRDYRFTKWMTKQLGLQGIPPSAFYSEPNKHLAEDYVRYCFFKDDATMQQAADILKQLKK